jgi:hypothetical protein
MELSLNIIHQRRAASPPIPDAAFHVFRKLALAVDSYQAAIWKL